MKIRSYETSNCWVEVTGYDYEATGPFSKEIGEMEKLKRNIQLRYKTGYLMACQN